MRSARQRRYLMWGAVWFTAVTGLVWLLLVGFMVLRLARGNVDGPRSWDEAVFGPSLAATVCLVPGWLVFLLAGRYGVSPSGVPTSEGGADRVAMSGASSAGAEAPSRPNPLILILAGWGIRFAGVGIAVGVAMNTPLAKDMGFWLSLVVLYGVTLAMETAIVRRVPDIV